MSPVLISTEYTLVIDTDSFSDSFAKKLCAYCTGILDEKDIGREYADMFYDEHGIEDDASSRGRVAEEKNPFTPIIGQRLDDNLVYSPCCVWLNKRYGYNTNGEYALLTEENYDDYNFPAPLSVGIFFDFEPTTELVQKIKERSSKFFEQVWRSSKKIKVEGFRLIVHTKYGVEKDL